MKIKAFSTFSSNNCRIKTYRQKKAFCRCDCRMAKRVIIRQNIQKAIDSGDKTSRYYSSKRTLDCGDSPLYARNSQPNNFCLSPGVLLEKLNQVLFPNWLDSIADN